MSNELQFSGHIPENPVSLVEVLVHVVGGRVAGRCRPVDVATWTRHVCGHYDVNHFVRMSDVNSNCCVLHAVRA